MLSLSLIFGMGTLKISYIWSCCGLLPGPFYLLLCLSQHTLLQDLEGSLQLPKYHRHIHRFLSVCSKSYCFFSRFFSALWRTRLNNVVDKPSPCLNPQLVTKSLLIFPFTITFPWAPSSVIFTGRSIFLVISKTH